MTARILRPRTAGGPLIQKNIERGRPATIQRRSLNKTMGVRRGQGTGSSTGVIPRARRAIARKMDRKNRGEAVARIELPKDILRVIERKLVMRTVKRTSAGISAVEGGVVAGFGALGSLDALTGALRIVGMTVGSTAFLGSGGQAVLAGRKERALNREI